MMVGLKLGLSIGGALVASILGSYGYVPNSPGEQTESAILGTKMLVSVFPSIPFLLAAGLLFFYIIDKELEDKIGPINKRRPVSYTHLTLPTKRIV